MSDQSENPAVSTDPSTWVDGYGDYLFRYAMMRVRDRDHAENLVQETFLAALSARARFSGRSTERTWLVGILKHKILDHFRKDFREKPVSNLQSEDTPINDFFDRQGHIKEMPGSWMPDPQALAERAEFWDVLRNCIDKLPSATASVFTMRELEGMDTKSLCKELDITPTNLWVMLHRARASLRKCLEQNWFEEH